MDIIREPVQFEGAVSFTQLPTQRPTKLVGTSPNVFGNEYWISDNNGTIVDFTKGSEGQYLRILGDGSTIVSHNGSIRTNTAANKVLAAGVVYSFTRYNNVWYESADANSGGGGGSYPYLTAYANQTLVYGNQASPLVAALTAPGYVGTSFAIIADAANNGGDNDANIYLVNGASGSFVAMANQIYAGGDQALRINYNLLRDSAGWHSSDPNTPSNQLAFETDGAMGLEYVKPDVSAPGPYDALAGKAFKWFGAGFPFGAGNTKTKYPMFTSGEPGRGLDFGVEDGGTGSSYGARIRIDDSSVADAIYLWVNGALRQVHAFNDGLGHNVLYY